MKRVVVTGLGLITAIGDGVQNTWDNLILCKSGIKKITNFDTIDLTCKIAGHINHNQNDPKSKIFCSAMEEWKKSKKVVLK